MPWNPSRAPSWEEPQCGASDRSWDVYLCEGAVQSKGACLPPSCLFWGAATVQGARLCLPMQMVMYMIYSNFLHRCPTWVLLSPLWVNSMGTQSLAGEIFSVLISWGPAQFCFADDWNHLCAQALWMSLTYWCSLANASKVLGSSSIFLEIIKWLLAEIVF